MARIAVVFPAPFGPRKPRIRPGRTLNEQPSSATTGPNRLACPHDRQHTPCVATLAAGSRIAASAAIARAADAARQRRSRARGGGCQPDFPRRMRVGDAGAGCEPVAYVGPASRRHAIAAACRHEVPSRRLASRSRRPPLVRGRRLRARGQRVGDLEPAADQLVGRRRRDRRRRRQHRLDDRPRRLRSAAWGRTPAVSSGHRSRAGRRPCSRPSTAPSTPSSRMARAAGTSAAASRRSERPPITNLAHDHVRRRRRLELGTRCRTARRTRCALVGREDALRRRRVRDDRQLVAQRHRRAHRVDRCADGLGTEPGELGLAARALARRRDALCQRLVHGDRRRLPRWARGACRASGSATTWNPAPSGAA